MIAPRLVMIRASAGSGKTFRLTNRFIALLAAGAAPERIVALTFTRKAAGEFFDGILGKLAAAAAGEAEARRLGRELGRSDLRAADFGRMLRAMAGALHRLRLGTLDSFFAQIARAFPFELGLAGDFSVLDPQAARTERRRVLRLLFARSGGRLDGAQREFLEAFKRATFGTEEKQLAGRLDGFLDEHHETFLAVPQAELWGGADLIWPAGQPWLGQVDLPAALSGLRRWLATAAMTDGQRRRWEDFAAAVETWAPGLPWPKPMEYLLPRALENWETLGAGAAEFTVERKKQQVDGAGAAALLEILRHVAGGELQRRLEATRGIHALLESYDRVYDAQVRRAGRLTFGDVERLLRPGDGRPGLGGDGAGRLLLDYRLDAGIDHWLLDEFQDTSRGQWSVLQNLIDEVVQDEEGGRTFFCVGDVKQSIYGWREGDPTLMGDIRRHYNGGDAAGGPIESEPLDASWRSGPAIIGLVNTVFGAAGVLGEVLPGAGAARWNEGWREHATERKERSGQAAVLFAADAEDRRRQTLKLIGEIAPLARGLTCAVLVRRNSEAAELADFLRREGGVPAVAESDLAVCVDHPAGTALLALVQAAAHPGDTLAWEHVRMTPLRAALEAEGLATRADVTRRVLAEIGGQGFERWAGHWLARLPAETDFARERARQFIAAAALFDAAGRRDPDEFGEFMSRHLLREAESAAVVRVMTIHKAKGLGFDVVILPELQGTKLAAARDGLAIGRGPGREPRWVLELPAAWLARLDPVLRARLEESEQEAAYEALSLLYVAMTRAKRAMYVVLEPPKAGSTSHNYPMLLTAVCGDEARPVRVGRLEFAGPWSAGEADWHCAVKEAAPSEPPAALPVFQAASVPRRPARRPSGEAVGEREASTLFVRRESAGRQFGAQVHALLAQIEWCGPGEVERHVALWRAGGAADAVLAHAESALRAPALAEIWSRPGGAARAEVWRERAFEVVIDGTWVSGIFDRVVVVRDGTGRAVGATVYDFKTDASKEAGETGGATGRHVAQLSLYRRVVARLTGMGPEAVGAELVYTGPGLRRVLTANG